MPTAAVTSPPSAVASQPVESDDVTLVGLMAATQRRKFVPDDVNPELTEIAVRWALDYPQDKAFRYPTEVIRRCDEQQRDPSPQETAGLLNCMVTEYIARGNRLPYNGGEAAQLDLVAVPLVSSYYVQLDDDHARCVRVKPFTSRNDGSLVVEIYDAPPDTRSMMGAAGIYLEPTGAYKPAFWRNRPLMPVDRLAVRELIGSTLEQQDDYATLFAYAFDRCANCLRPFADPVDRALLMGRCLPCEALLSVARPQD